MIATRVPALSSACYAWLLEDPSSFNYDEKSATRMREAGWYVPPRVQGGLPYTGLTPQYTVNCASDFRLNPRHEKQKPGLVHLASYVGEADGSHSIALHEAARLLDDGFSGLCVHVVPPMEGLADCGEEANAASRCLSDFAKSTRSGN